MIFWRYDGTEAGMLSEWAVHISDGTTIEQLRSECLERIARRDRQVSPDEMDARFQAQQKLSKIISEIEQTQKVRK